MMQTLKGRKSPSPIPVEIWVLVYAAFIIAVGFGLVAPIIPQFAQSFNVSVALASFVISIFALSRLLFAPMSGALVEKIGSRRVYIAGLSTVAVTTGMIAFVTEYWQILVLRGLAGIGSTMFTVSAMGLIVRLSPPAVRGRSSSIYGTAFLLGSIIGPVIGAVLSRWGMRVPFIIYAVALLLAAAVVWRMLNPQKIYDVEHTNTMPPMQVSVAVKDSAYRAALLSGFANGWTNFGVRVALLPLFAAATFHKGGAVAGIALAAFAAGNAVALQFSGRLADSLGRKPMIVAGTIVSGVLTIVLGFMQGPTAVLLVSAGAGFGAGMFVPAQQATIADVIGNKRSGGAVLARFQMTQDFGAIIGPVCAGFLADTYGYSTAFAVSGAALVVAGLIWLTARETLPTQRDAAAAEAAATTHTTGGKAAHQ